MGKLTNTISSLIPLVVIIAIVIAFFKFGGAGLLKDVFGQLKGLGTQISNDQQQREESRDVEIQKAKEETVKAKEAVLEKEQQTAEEVKEAVAREAAQTEEVIGSQISESDKTAKIRGAKAAAQERKTQRLITNSEIERINNKLTSGKVLTPTEIQLLEKNGIIVGASAKKLAGVQPSKPKDTASAKAQKIAEIRTRSSGAVTKPKPSTPAKSAKADKIAAIRTRSSGAVTKPTTSAKAEKIANIRAQKKTSVAKPTVKATTSPKAQKIVATKKTAGRR